MDNRWRFRIGNVSCWARTIPNGVTLFLVYKKSASESKIRITFKKFENYIFFVNQLIEIGNQLQSSLDENEREKILIELKNIVEK